MNEFLRTVFIGYFVTHIPITLCIDMQILFGNYYPTTLQSLYKWYYTFFNDQLLRYPPVWLKSFIYAEIALQLPFFFVASYGLIYKKNWIRIPSILYGSHVATTVLPILAEALMSKSNTNQEKMLLCTVYLPYFVIPATLACYMSFYPSPFTTKSKKK